MRLFTDRIHSFTEERHAPLLIHFIQHQHRRRYNLVNRQRHAHRTPATSIITFITQNKCEITITIYISIWVRVYHNKIHINIQMWCDVVIVQCKVYGMQMTELKNFLDAMQIVCWGRGGSIYMYMGRTIFGGTIFGHSYLDFACIIDHINSQHCLAIYIMFCARRTY